MEVWKLTSKKVVISMINHIVLWYGNLPMVFKVAIDITSIPTMIFTITNLIKAFLPDDIENVVIPCIAMGLGALLYYGVGANPMEGIFKGLEAVGMAVGIAKVQEAKENFVAKKNGNGDKNSITGGKDILPG